MKNHWRDLLHIMPLPVEKYFHNKYFLNQHNDLVKKQSNFPPSHFSKQEALVEIAKYYNLKILVETGTYFGDMLFALYDRFDKFFSIELSNKLYERARKRFKKQSKIYLILGDSSEKLNDIIKQLNEPALFWLDGHYSGGITAKGDKECPVFEELNAIFSSNLNHVVIIDDARLFVGKNDYPTINSIRDYINTKKSFYKISVINDAIRILP